MASVVVSNIKSAVVSTTTFSVTFCGAISNVDMTLLSSVFDTGMVASAATASPSIAWF